MTHSNILIAGGHGKLGSALGRRGANALGRSQLNVLSDASIAAAFSFHMPKLVINCTAYTNVDKAETDAEAVFALNADGAKRLAEQCVQAEIPLIHISTDCVFGDGTPDKPVTELDKTEPLSVYGHSKLAGEHAVQGAGVRSCIARVSWLFDDGPQSFIGKMLAIAEGRDKLQIVDDAHGRPTEVGALADKLVELAELMIAGEDVPPILHLGPPNPASRFEWAQAIFAASAEQGGPTPLLSPCSSDVFQEAARRPRGLVLDTQLADKWLSSFLPWQAASDIAVRQILGDQNT